MTNYITTLRESFQLLPSTSLVLITIILTIIHFVAKSNQQQRLRRKIKSLGLKTFEEIPAPPRWPIIGSMHLMRDYEHDSWAGLDMIRRKYGDIVLLQMGQLQMVMISSYELMRELLLEKGEQFANRPALDRLDIVFGSRSHSLALGDYSNVHKDRRKMCMRAINPTRFSIRNELLESLTVKHTRQWIEQFSAQILNGKKTQANLTKTDTLFLTGDHFLEYLAGEKRSHSDEAYRDFNYGADFLFWEIQQSYVVDFFPKLKHLGLSRSQLKRLDFMSRKLRKYVDDDVWLPRFNKLDSMRKANKLNEMTLSDENATNFLDSMIIDHFGQASNLSLEDYQLGFADLYGGHAAVANMLMRTLGHLSLRPDIQELVYEEAERVKLDQVNLVPNLILAEAVVQESLRIASSPIVPHVARVNCSIGGYYIPVNTTILLNNYHINRSQKHWDKPLEWNPLRFIDSTSGELRIPAHFMPFSVGTRACLGTRMVQEICTYACAYLCHEFYLEPNDADLVEKLLKPQGMLGLNPDAECYEIMLKARR